MPVSRYTLDGKEHENVRGVMDMEFFDTSVDNCLKNVQDASRILKCKAAADLLFPDMKISIEMFGDLLFFLSC